MGNEKGEKLKQNSKDFDLNKELSTLVDERIIPQKIADKLEEKINERNIKLNKSQIRLLAIKINEFIENYSKNGTLKNNKQKNELTVENSKLLDVIEQLEQRIANLETGNTDYNRKENVSGIVTTDDIKITGWQMEPLTQVPNDPENIIVVMKWLQYLVDKCSHTFLSEVLDYYVDIGWITDNAKISLVDYSQGITGEGNKNNTSGKTTNLPAKDHIQSLLYIQKLKGVQLDKHFLDRIEGELSRIQKKIDNYKFK